MRLLGMCIGVLLSLPSAALADSAPNSLREPEAEIAVLIRSTARTLPSEPEDLLDALSVGAPRRGELLARLRNPVSVRFLTTDRYSKERRQELSRSDPFRVLDSYVILSFDDRFVAGTVQPLLRADPDVEYAHVLTRLHFAATPSDYLFPYVSGTTKTIHRQWGAQALNLEAAWNFIQGHAYVAVLDNGIYEPTPGQVHPDLQQNLRKHFSQSYVGGGATGLDERQFGNFTFAGHGTHVAGIIGAQANGPQPTTGVAGTCWNCSLMIGRVGFGAGPTDAALADAIQSMARRGAQVINLSLAASTTPDCLFNPSHALCQALAAARYRDVAIVAAAGNSKTTVQFPASDYRVIAVGGIQDGGSLWDQEVALPDSPRRVMSATEIGSNSGSGLALVAPARDIVSTFYPGYNWSEQIRCGSATSFYSAFIDGGSAPGMSAFENPGTLHGICTGTSMAAPFVSGVAALVRSANPLLTVDQVRIFLTQHASRAGTPDANWGYGIPDASASVQSALNTNSRLTPLFALYDNVGGDYLQTTVPQMGVAAWAQTLLPTLPSPPKYQSYSYIGNPITGYKYFPGMTPPVYPPRSGQDGEMPRARIRVFTTPTDASGQVLDPLVRFSYTNGSIVRHVYAVGQADANAILANGWTIDGIEGYVYPTTIAQPAGTTALYRWVNPSLATYMLVPEGDQAIWSVRGFVSDGGVRGFAYVTSSIFSDVPYGHYAQAEVEAMYHNQITTGCGGNPPFPPPVYCPLTHVTRSQMATFVGRRNHGPGWFPPSYTSPFPDVPNGPSPPAHVLKDWIVQTYNDGIMGQCPTSPGNFCPDTAILREEMAQVLLKAKYGSTYSPPSIVGQAQIFDDVPLNSPWAPWIHRLYQEGITSGCMVNPLRYCPTASVDRTSMAIFFSKAFGLLH